MYKAYLDGELLYHPNVPKLLPLATAKWDGEVNKAGTFSFLIYKDNQMYGKIRKMRSIVKLYDDDFRLFRGRVYSVKKNLYNGLQVICEGELAFFNDTEVRPYSFTGSVEKYFAFLVTQHNEQVEEEKQFKIGICTVTDPNDYIVRESSDYPKTLNEMKEKLIDLLGGYLWTREEKDGIYIDYLADFELTNTQPIKFGENLLDLEDLVKGNEIATAIRPLGAKLLDEEGNETEERLTIESVNDGVDYVYSEEAVERYGWIYKTVTFDDVTLASNLLRKGMEELEEYIQLSQTIELTAVDLHALNVDIQSFRLGRYTRVESEPHDMEDIFLTRKLSINILKPGSDSKMNLGDERKTFVDKQVKTNQTVSGNITKTESAISDLKHYTENIKIGARNLIRNSTNLIFSDYYFSGGTDFVYILDEDGNRLLDEDGNVLVIEAERIYLLDEDGNYLLDESGNRLIT